MSLRVAVTGATGFIGGHTVARLESEGMTVTRVGLRDDIAEGVRGSSAVVHLAPSAHEASKPPARLLEENVRITQRAFEAAVATGATCFVNMSSIAAVVRASSAPVTDDTPSGALSPYGEAKRKSELWLDQAAQGTSVRVVHLRPPSVYGPRMRGKSKVLFRFIEVGVPLPLAGIENRRSFMYVGNVAQAISLALTTPALSGGYVRSDAEPISTSEFARRIAAAFGRRARLLRVPAFLRGRFAESLPVDSSRFWDTTRTAPMFSMAEGIRITADWCTRVNDHV